MLEMISLVSFGFIVYMCLIVIPTTIERFTCEEFRNAYFSHLASPSINSYGK